MELCELTVTEASTMIRSGNLSPVALMESLLEHIQTLEPSLKAWETLDKHAALRMAGAGEITLKKEGPQGPLHGIPVGVKDIFYTSGVATKAGTPQYADFVPTYDAFSVARLKEAGAIVLGKTVTTQFASGDPARTLNPWDPAHTPGGSSTGSAVAVAARMCPVALGSQTIGSVLRPAAYNGVIGFKPTYGRISKFGVVPNAWSLDTVGVLARSIEDAALLLKVMAGHDPQDVTSSMLPASDYLGALERSHSPPRIGLVREFFYEHAEEEVRRHTNDVIDVLRQAGSSIQEINVPQSFYAHEAARTVVARVEAAAFHQQMFAEDPDAYRPVIRSQIEQGMLIPGVAYLQAQRVRRQFSMDMRIVLSGVDVLITPTTPSSAPRDLTTTGNTIFQGAWTSCGLPAITIPTGLDSNGLPLGIQFVAAPFAEGRLLSTALWCSRVLGVTMVPPGLGLSTL